MKRKIIQIAFSPYEDSDIGLTTLWVLCDDGTIWYRSNYNGAWQEDTPDLECEDSEA